MHISFNGVIKPYTYNCPYAHKLRSIDKIYPKRITDEKSETKKTSNAQAFGIEHHDLISEYIQDKTNFYEYTTDTIEWFKEHKASTEKQRFYSLDFQRIFARPEEGDFISTRIDAMVQLPGKLVLGDWKSGNPEYSAPIYYDETDFFIAMEASANPAIGEWETVIHFPIADYTLPRRTYNHTQIVRLQDKYMKRIDTIVNDKRFIPKPSKIHCRFCDYRSEDTGGTGHCEHTVV